MDEYLLETGALESQAPVINFSSIAFFGIALFAALFVLIAVIIIQKYLRRPDLVGLTREDIQKKWMEIERVSGQGLMGAKMAIVEADALLDNVLKSLMIPGETMAERLKVGGYKYPELKHVWFAHKLRNQIVHESTFELTERNARSAIHEYKKALRTIHAL